ncbi:MAG: hypothetical protein ACI8UO_002880 [Verrucomicrobiales bacterium]|jgi:hypothetical protein
MGRLPRSFGGSSAFVVFHCGLHGVQQLLKRFFEFGAGIEGFSVWAEHRDQASMREITLAGAAILHAQSNGEFEHVVLLAMQ